MAEKPQYPANHVPGMRVPKGGSSCGSCEYYKGMMTCGNEYFIRWNGSNKIPAPAADEYCSDWYEPSKHAPLSAEAVMNIRRKVS